MHALRIFLVPALFLLLPLSSRAENPPLSIPGGVTCQLIGTYDTARLDTIGTTELADFQITKSSLTLAPAANAVKLYRVHYPTVIPEQGNRPVTASGLLAVPDTTATALPVVSYQHGTVFSKTEVPSQPEQSAETRFVIAAFAAHGYAVIAPDYIGKGDSSEPDSYLVRESTAQACHDMLTASQSILVALGKTSGPLFLSGWSQGAWSTMIFRERLERLGIPVKAAATACTPSDLTLLVSRWINHPTSLDAAWIVGCVALFLHSYEYYYDLPGLTATAIRPAYLQTARDFYDNKISWAEASKALPKTINEFLQPSFASASSLLANPFYRRLSANQAYQWRYATPTIFYYGQADEVITPYIATLPVGYQDTIGGAPSRSVDAGATADHRGAFLFGLPNQKKWFDSLLAR